MQSEHDVSQLSKRNMIEKLGLVIEFPFDKADSWTYIKSAHIEWYDGLDNKFTILTMNFGRQRKRGAETISTTIR